MFSLDDQEIIAKEISHSFGKFFVAKGGRLLSDILIEQTQELIMSCLVHFPFRFWAGNKDSIFLYLEVVT